MYLGPLTSFGTDNQIEEFVKPFLDGTKVGCFALSEPGIFDRITWFYSTAPSFVFLILQEMEVMQEQRQH